MRSSSTDDVACWFVDTDYNGESFFVRHAYFTCAGDPYERLRVRDITENGVVLLFGKKETPTPLSWATLEGVAEFLAGGRWVVIGSVFDVQGDASTLDGHLKQYMKRATAGWVAALLERAGVVEIDRGRPARVRTRPGFAGGVTT